MMTQPCKLTYRFGENDPNGKTWCDECKRYHTGHTTKWAIGTDEYSDYKRMIWRGIPNQIEEPQRSQPNWIRPPALSMICRHLDPAKISNEQAVGMEEIAKALETGCKGCSGYTTMQRCHGGGGVQGITTISYCSNRCEDHYDPLPICDAAMRIMPPPKKYSEDRCILLCGGGVYESSLWVTVKMIRRVEPDIKILLYHGNTESLNYKAFEDVTIVKAPAEISSGWPMKSYALLKSPYSKVLFLDADFYPTDSLQRHFDAPSGVLCANSIWNAIEWDKYGLTPDDRTPLDGGFWMIDKNRHWKLVWLFYYLNTLRHEITYKWGVGDQDQLRAALRYLEINYDSIGQTELIGKAAVYPGVGVHRFNDKFRQRGSGLREYTTRPVPDSKLPLDSVAFKFFYDYDRLYLNKS